MIPVWQFVVLIMTSVAVAAAARVVDRVVLDAQQSKSAALEGATTARKKVEGATKKKGSSKMSHGSSKKSYHGYELLGDGACLEPEGSMSKFINLENDMQLKGQDDCIAACSLERNCTGITFSENNFCQLHLIWTIEVDPFIESEGEKQERTVWKQWKQLRGWKQDAAACEQFAVDAGEDRLSFLKSLNGACFHEDAFGNGTRCHDCEVVFRNSYENWMTSEERHRRCDEDFDRISHSTYALLFGRESNETCEIFFVRQDINFGHYIKDGWGRAGSCYKKCDDKKCDDKKSDDKKSDDKKSDGKKSDDKKSDDKKSDAVQQPALGSLLFSLLFCVLY